MHKHNIKLLSLFNFFHNFRFYSVIAILYFSDVSGSYALGMSVFSLIMIFSAIFEVPTGVLSDLLGRKKTMVIGAIAGFCSVIVFAMANSFQFLVIGTIFQGLSRSMFSGNNDSLLYDSLKETNKHKNFSSWLGKVTAWSQFGAGIAAVLGSILASWSFRWTMWASAVPIFITILIALFIKEPKVSKPNEGNIFRHIKEAFTYFKTNPKLRLFSIIRIWYFSIDEAGYYFNSVFVKMVWPIWAIGFMKVVSKIIGVIAFSYSGKIIRKFGARKIIVIRSLWDHISRFVALIFPTIFSPILMSTNQLLWTTGQISEKSLLQKEFTDHQRSTMESLTSLVESIGFSIIAFILGYIGDLYGPVTALLVLQFGKVPLMIFIKKLYYVVK